MGLSRVQRRSQPHSFRTHERTGRVENDGDNSDQGKGHVLRGWNGNSNNKRLNASPVSPAPSTSTTAGQPSPLPPSPTANPSRASAPVDSISRRSEILNWSSQTSGNGNNALPNPTSRDNSDVSPGNQIAVSSQKKIIESGVAAPGAYFTPSSPSSPSMKGETGTSIGVSSTGVPISPAYQSEAASPPSSVTVAVIILSVVLLIVLVAVFLRRHFFDRSKAKPLLRCTSKYNGPNGNSPTPPVFRPVSIIETSLDDRETLTHNNSIGTLSDPFCDSRLESPIATIHSYDRSRTSTDTSSIDSVDSADIIFSTFSAARMSMHMLHPTLSPPNHYSLYTVDEGSVE